MPSLCKIVSAMAVLCMIYLPFGLAEADEDSCNCIIALTSESGFQRNNQMYNVMFTDATLQCDSASTQRCLTKCQQGFLRSTGGGDLSYKSRRSPKKIGELLCIEYNQDVNNKEVGLYYKSCYDTDVKDSTTRASRNICCTSGQFSHC